MKLIDNPHKCLKLLSVQANTFGIAISGAYASLYDHLKDTIPPHLMAILTGLVFGAGILGRIISQQTKEDDDDK